MSAARLHSSEPSAPVWAAGSRVTLASCGAFSEMSLYRSQLQYEAKSEVFARELRIVIAMKGVM